MSLVSFRLYIGIQILIEKVTTNISLNLFAKTLLQIQSIN